MKKETRVFFIMMILFFTGLWIIALKVWKDSEDTAKLSCLSSIAAGIDKARTQGKIKIDTQLRILTKDEVEQLLKQINAYECSEKDLSSEEIHIALGYENKPNSLLDIKVWTNGSGRISGTEDDLVIPYGEKSLK